MGCVYQWRKDCCQTRLLYGTSHECYDMPAIGSREWLTRIAFEELEGRTKLTHSILHPTTEARYGHLQAGMKAGTVQTLNRLAKKVALKAEACVTNA